MNHSLYEKALVVFFALNALIWTPWGFYCLVLPEVMSGQGVPGMDVFDLSHFVARVEVRAMYGGLQIALGLLALAAWLKKEHRPTALLFFMFALTGLALSRFYGLVVDGNGQIFVFSTTLTPETYNQVAFNLYEFPFMLYAWCLFITGKYHQ